MKTFICACLCGLSIAASGQLKYSNKEFGVSFEYPSEYVLQKGDLDKSKDIGMGYLGPIPMEFVAPGGIRLATVEVPKGSYPGTDFVNAFFTISVNRHVTNSECEQFTDARATASSKEPLKEISGVHFPGVRIGFAGMSHQFSGAYFHGFSEGLCYELGYGIATAGYGAVDGLKRVDRTSVFSILKSVLDSVTVSKRSSGAANSPSILAFRATPLDLKPQTSLGLRDAAFPEAM